MVENDELMEIVMGNLSAFNLYCARPLFSSHRKSVTILFITFMCLRSKVGDGHNLDHNIRRRTQIQTSVIEPGQFVP